MTIVMAFSFIACGGSEDEPTNTVTVTAGPEVPQDKEDMFLTILRDGTDFFDDVPDNEILDLGYAVCEAWDAGVTFKDIAVAAVDSGIPAGDAGYLVGAATKAFCPQHSPKIQNSGV